MGERSLIHFVYIVFVNRGELCEKKVPEHGDCGIFFLCVKKARFRIVRHLETEREFVLANHALVLVWLQVEQGHIDLLYNGVVAVFFCD